MNKILIGILAGSLLITACETANNGAGTGSGNVRGTTKPVAFTWQGTDDKTGGLTATFASGRVFKGKYFQITQDTHVDRLDPLWDGWDHTSRGESWRYWTSDPGSKFKDTYSGRVLANLAADNGEHMRCRFTLATPSRGMAGGGEGRCQLSETGKEINADFPRQS